MNVRKFMAAQLRMPSGWFGSLVVSRMMNRVNRAIIDSTVEFLDVAPHHQVLEIGFGGGSALARIATMVNKGSVTGLDLSPDLVYKAGKKFQREIAAGRVRLQLGNVSQLPFPDAVFDRVFTINTIYFWPDALRGLGEIRRVLKEGGRAVVSLRSGETMKQYSVTKYNFRLFLPQEAADLMRQAGFCDVRLEERRQGTLYSEVIGIGIR